MAAFVPGMPGAKRLTTGFFAVFTFTSLVYLATTWGEPNYPVLYALLQVNLANLTCAAMVVSFSAMRVEFEQSEAKAEALEITS